MSKQGEPMGNDPAPPTAAASLRAAADKLLCEGPAAALTYLTDIADLKDPSVLRRIRSIVFLHRKRIESEAGIEFLRRSVFDPVYCQCSICQRSWTMSPLLDSPYVPRDELQQFIVGAETKSCASCGNVYCRRCAATAGKSCTCGATLAPLTRPNGRASLRPAREPASEPMPDAGPAAPASGDPNLHFYFGTEGKIPIAIDSSFSLDQTASSDAHLDWAEALLDAGQYYQAQQQLDLLRPTGAENGRNAWLRARLRWVQLRNLQASQRMRKVPVILTQRKEQRWCSEIHGLLEQACRYAPGDGRIWLTRAQAYLESDLGRIDAEQALQCAEQAKGVLGEDPQVLYMQGLSLHAMGEQSAALTTLQKVSSDSEYYSQAQQRATLAGLALRCGREALDIDAHLQLGYWFWRHDQRDRSKPLFAHLKEAAPDCAETLFVQGLLVWFEFNHPQRFNLAHRHYRSALERKPDFGLVYQYLGILFHATSYAREELDYEPGNPEEAYERAVALDPSCDLALGKLGQLAIDRGDIRAALSWFERAAALDTTFHNVYLNLAAIYLGTRQFQKQEQAYRKATELEPLIGLRAEYVDRILSLCNFEY